MSFDMNSCMNRVILPVQNGQRWDLDVLLDMLETFLTNPRLVAPVMPSITGAIHLADQATVLTERLSGLFVAYIKRVSMTNSVQYDAPLNLLAAFWAYELTNAFFVSARDRFTVISWIKAHTAPLDASFLEGLDSLTQALPSFLSGPGSVRCIEALRVLKQDVLAAKRSA
jgi:hypothetical protein